MRTSWNDDEDEALQGLPLDAQVLYLRALRRRMDYRTGMVGNLPGVNGISWRILADDLFVEPHQGISGGKPDESKVRRLMKWLVTRGLVVDRGTGRNLIFFLPLASADESEQKKADRKPTGSRQGLADMENVISINGFDYEADRKPTGGCVRKADTIPESGIREEEDPLTPPRGAVAPSRFAEFWDAWPDVRKRGKKNAEAIWARRKLDGMADTLIADVLNRKDHDEQWRRGYVPMPTTYLNGDRWTDCMGEQEVVPFRNVIDIYCRVLPELDAPIPAAWESVDYQPANDLRARWKENQQHQSPEFWEAFFSAVRAIPYCMGQGGIDFKANLAWLVEPKNFYKVAERLPRQRAGQSA